MLRVFGVWFLFVSCCVFLIIAIRWRQISTSRLCAWRTCFRDVFKTATSLFGDLFRGCLEPSWKLFGEGNIMASGTGEPSAGHDAELDELLDSKGWHWIFIATPTLARTVCSGARNGTPPLSLCVRTQELACVLGGTSRLGPRYRRSGLRYRWHLGQPVLSYHKKNKKK